MDPRWVRLFADAKESEALAKQAPSANGIYVVPAFTGLGAPYWDQNVRGAMFGLTRGTNRAQITRATIEAIAFQTRDVVDTMVQETQLPLQKLAVDGGASRNNLLLQFQADILQTPIVRAAVEETTALGAAFLAGLAVGYWDDLAQLAQLSHAGQQYTPQQSAAWLVTFMRGGNKPSGRPNYLVSR